MKTAYVYNIAARVKSYWKYQGADDDWGCDVYILQSIEGVVEAVNDLGLQVGADSDLSMSVDATGVIIQNQVSMGIAIRMACLKILIDNKNVY